MITTQGDGMGERAPFPGCGDQVSLQLGKATTYSNIIRCVVHTLPGLPVPGAHGFLATYCRCVLPGIIMGVLIRADDVLEDLIIL